MARQIFSFINTLVKDYERSSIIQSNQRLSKLGDTVYHLKAVDFNEETRVAKVEIESTKQYRTIERYVTQDYEKYPVYSDWKYKTTTLRKTLRLINENLEQLNKHEDAVISLLASEIIISIKNEELFPSWLFAKYLHDKLEQDIATNIEIKQSLTYSKKQTFAGIQSERNQAEISLKDMEDSKNHLSNQLVKLSKKLEKIHNHKKSIFLTIITFSLYYFLNSPKREQSLLNKKNEKTQTHEKLISDIVKQKDTLSSIKNNTLEVQNIYNLEMQQADENINILKQEYLVNLKQISPLPITLKQNESFLPLKSLGGLKYEKIIGCYVLCNNEKEKYYVGQSKDILKRIKQHFKGTEPKNIVFAEDYFSSEWEQKENLFSVKMIYLETKDELDEKEKELIEFYDAFNNGYNGTQGNT